MDWIVVVTPAAASLLTLFLSNWHARRMAAGEREATRDRLRIELAERRYEDRRDAVIALDQAAEQQTDTIADFQMQHGNRLSPGDVIDDYRFEDLMAAHARVAMLATLAVVDAAEGLKSAVIAVFSGTDGSWSRYHAALAEYRVQSRAMLSGDLSMQLPTKD